MNIQSVSFTSDVSLIMHFLAKCNTNACSIDRLKTFIHISNKDIIYTLITSSVNASVLPFTECHYNFVFESFRHLTLRLQLQAKPSRSCLWIQLYVCMCIHILYVYIYLYFYTLCVCVCEKATEPERSASQNDLSVRFGQGWRAEVQLWRELAPEPSEI